MANATIIDSTLTQDQQLQLEYVEEGITRFFEENPLLPECQLVRVNRDFEALTITIQVELPDGRNVSIDVPVYEYDPRNLAKILLAKFFNGQEG